MWKTSLSRLKRLSESSSFHQNAFGDNKHNLLALPTSLGVLGIADPSKQAAPQRTACRNITAPLVELIIDQTDVYAPETKAAQTRAQIVTFTDNSRQKQMLNSPKLPSEGYRRVIRKRSFKLAIHPTHGGTRLRRALQVGYLPYPW